MSRAAAVGGTALAAGALLLAGCAATAPATTAPPRAGGTAAATVTVSRGSVAAVVTVPATVTAGATTTVTLPVAGTVTSLGPDAVGYTTAAGSPATLKLPAGLRLSRPLVSAGDRVPANYPVAEARSEGFALVATLDRATLYRLYTPPRSARGQIDQGPGPFDCPLADRLPSRGATEEDGPAAVVSCLVPGDLPVFAGMPGVIALTTARAENVLLLPVEAVAGTVRRGTVTVQEPGGGTHRQEVTLGLTDGARIEVSDGLREGEVVRSPGPDLTGGSTG